MKHKTGLALAFGLFASVFLNGCSGGGSSTSSPPTTSAAPTVTSISPTSAQAGSGSLALTVNGTGFTSSTTVQVGGIVDQTKYVSGTQVTVEVTASQLSSGGNLAIIALNGTASSGSGAEIDLAVTNPVPSITQLSPATLSSSSSGAEISVTGSGFVPSTVINVNGIARVTTYVSATQVNVALTGADLSAGGSLSITAVNAAPGGGTSAALTLAIANPAPGSQITLSPQTVLAGAASPPTIIVTGTGFVPSSVVQFNGTAVATTYVNNTQLSFTLTKAQDANQGVAKIAVVNPAPGGGTTATAALDILAATPTPVITQVSPAQFIVGSGDSQITVTGTNLVVQPDAYDYVTPTTVQWNGTSLKTLSYNIGPNQAQWLTAQVPASLLTAIGTASVTVSSTLSTPAISNALTVSITNPPAPTLTSISPGSGSIGTAANVTLAGTGFTSQSTVTLNGSKISSTYVNSGQITVAIPASSLALPGNVSLAVTTPAPGGGTSQALPFTGYIGIPNNSMVYDSVHGLFYVSVPSSAGAPYGNSVVSVDPATGALGTPILVGSEPDRLAITADGKYLWVALDGASAVRQVDLTAGTAGLQFTLGQNSGVYDSPSQVFALAALPGQDNSVIVATNSNLNNGVTLGIFDSGVLRTNTVNGYLSNTFMALQVDGSKSEIYAAGTNTYSVFSYSASGLTQKSTASNGVYASYSSDDLQVTGGRAYSDAGTVYDAEAGALLGTFYATGSTAASGPVVADTVLGRAFILDNAQGYSYDGYSQIQSFNLSDFNPVSDGVIPVNGVNTSGTSSPSHLTRWGTNGLAFRTSEGVYSLRSNVVKDLSSTDADLAVTLTTSGAANTGANSTFTATVKNNGPNASTSAVLTGQLPSTGVVMSATSSAGSCSTASGLVCNLGDLASGASTTISIVVKQTTAGSGTATVQVAGSENDPDTGNNQASATVAVSGAGYNLAPTLTTVSPAAILAGSGDTTITLTGAGFSTGATVQLGNQQLATSVTNSTTLTATVPGAQLASMGWAPVTVTNPSPGGGVSAPLPLTIYSVTTIGLNHILYDPYSRKIMASAGSGSSSVAGNSIVAITPETGTIGTPTSIGSQPTNIALTSDGQVLYTLLAGSQSVARYNMLTQAADYTYAVQIPSTADSNSLRGIATVPGTENTIGIDLGSWGGSAIYDFDPTNKTAAIRGQATGPYSGSCITFPDATDMLAFDVDTSGQTFDHYTVKSSGFTYYDYQQYSESTLYHFGCFKTDGPLAFSIYGGVANYTTSPAMQVGIFNTPSAEGNGQQDVAPDISLNQVFFAGAALGSDYYFDQPTGITGFNMTTFMPNSSIPIDFADIEGANVSFTIPDLIRWGQDGLAVLTSSGHLYLLRGAFVVPQLLNSNTAAKLTAASLTSIAHGSGNTRITLTGSGFVPGVGVNWNGSYRTTTIVDATHLSVAIPASDLGKAGTASVVAINPGGAASNSLTITIQ